jgi:transcriptional regulator with XRE-family HTH domain
MKDLERRIAIENALRVELRDPEYSEGYAESYLNSYIATQIKVIREEQDMTQAQLAELVGTTQAGISRYENVNYSSWSIKSLIKIARAFHLRLRVSFESFGSLPREVSNFRRESLNRARREEDLDLWVGPVQEQLPGIGIGPNTEVSTIRDLRQLNVANGSTLLLRKNIEVASDVIEDFQFPAAEDYRYEVVEVGL